MNKTYHGDISEVNKSNSQLYGDSEQSYVMVSLHFVLDL